VSGSARDREDEAARLARVYGGYRQSRRKRRAWAADNPGNVAMRKELFERLVGLAGDRLEGNGRILDAGCGTGYWLQRLAEHGVDPRRLHGVDLLSERLGRRVGLPEAVELRRGDVRSLPYPDSHFELVLMFTVLSSLRSRADVERALREARRVLSPGGLLLCYEPRLPNPFNRHTVHVRARDYRLVLGPGVVERSLTVWPLLARRLGRAAPRVYPHATRIRRLTTHRLVSWRP
jgi:SAM-dependent methyltransferase